MVTAKQYLKQVYDLNREINMILAKADAMRKSLYGRGIQYNGTGGGAASDSIAKAIAKVVDYDHDADEAIDRLVDLRIEIEQAIKAVADPVQREVLERRYLMFEPFESGYDKKTGKYIKGIAESMNYSERQIYRIHGEALLKIHVSECQ
ncbi:MAG: hypothetical protein IJN57_03900 [Oscillospiraceae bacterium]|nr:hypothetical protein [Oscillospiraceae bacterium]